MAGSLSMRSEPQLKFVYLVVGQMLLLVVFLASLRSLRVDYFIVVSFILFLITTQLTAPLTVKPGWRVRLRWVLLGWLGAFGYVAFQRGSELWI